MTRSLILAAATVLCLAAACSTNTNDDSAGGTMTEPRPSAGQQADDTTQPAKYQRPWDVRLDGVDPCTLITPARQRALSVHNITGAGENNSGGLACSFTPLPGQDKPVGYSVHTAINHKYDFDVLLSLEGASLVEVAGFPAIQYELPGGLVPCEVKVPTFADHYLWVMIETLDIPMEEACERLTDFATSAVEALKAHR